MRIMIRSCLLIGLPLSVLGTFGTAALLSRIELPFVYYPAAAAFPLLCGCFASGYAAGKHLRHDGLCCGLTAALLLTGIWYLSVSLLTEQFRIPLLIFLTLPCGMCGGACGVNTALPEPRRRSHGIRHMQITAGMLPDRMQMRRARRNAKKKQHSTSVSA